MPAKALELKHTIKLIRELDTEIEEIENAIAEAKEQSGEHFTVKQMEKTRKTLEVKLKKLQSTDRKDDVVTF